jgi:hypothetical protein
MRRPKDQVTSGEDLFVGIDLHKSSGGVNQDVRIDNEHYRPSIA